MKRIVFILMAVTAFASINAEVITYDENNIRYKIDTESNEAIADRQTASMTDLTIPDYIVYQSKSYPVVEIAERFYYFGPTPKGQITIGNNVKVIGERAFYKCTGLTGSLNIPNSVEIIGDDAFYNCLKLTNLNLGDNLQIIGGYAFSYCSGFTGTLQIPVSVEEIGSQAFRETSFDKIIIGEINPDLHGKTTIGALAFYKSTCKTVVIGDNVISIGQQVFDYYCDIDSLYLGKNIESIGTSAFSNSLTSNVRNLKLPESLLSIGRRAFYNCSMTGSLKIPDSVETMETEAFSGCSGLNGTLELGENLTAIPSEAFYKCGFTGGLRIPDSVVSIGESAFSGCNFNGTLTLGKSLETVSHAAFSDCGFTGELRIPNSCTSVQFYAFGGMPDIETVIIGENLQKFGTSWHANNSTISQYGKVFTACPNIKTVISLCNTLPTYSSTAVNFENDVYNTAPLYVNEEALSLYQKTSSWSKFNTILVAPESLEADEEIIISVGENRQISSSITPSKYNYDIEWSIEEGDDVITLDKNGLVEGLKEGTATVNIKCLHLTSKCKVRVIAEVVANYLSLSSLSMEGVADKKNLKNTESIYLKASVGPENVTNKKVVWSASPSEAVAILPGEDGLEATITANKSNINNVVITAQVEKTPAVNATYEINISDLLLGDANDNGKVNVSDVITVANHILKYDTDNFCFINSDIDTNKFIDVADQASIVNMVSGVANSKSMKALPMAELGEDFLVIDDFYDGNRSIGLSLENARNYVSLQADIALPEGLELVGVEAGSQACEHIVAHNILDENTVRVLVYSLSNIPFAADGQLFKLHTSGITEPFEVSNVIVADVNAGRHELSVKGGQNLGINSPANPDVIYVVGGADEIIAGGTDGCDVDVFSIDGKLIRSFKSTVSPKRIAVEKGVYIIIFDKKSFKVVVK